MLSKAVIILASFTAPEQVGMNAKTMLWMLPLAAAIAGIYKAVKLHEITLKSFLKEAAVLFASIVVFIIAAAAALSLITYLATE
ncbi:MAG: hypothetical protein JW804_00270 [Sedimentisphaerales bacterium]|nr:hypothetical protein [Sedimentisphaerales bacterium]